MSDYPALFLVDSEYPISHLSEQIKNESNFIIISFDIEAHKKLSNIDLEHEISDNYLSESEIDEAQQWVGTLPVHNQRSVDRAAGSEPVGRLCVNCQHVPTWPSARRDVVEHDEIDRRRWVREVRRHGEVELGHAAQRPLEKSVALRDQQRAGVAPGQTQHRGGIVHGEYVVVVVF